MSGLRIKYLNWLIWLAHHVSTAIDKIHRKAKHEEDWGGDNHPEIMRVYERHRRDMLRRHRDKPCLCDLHNYSRHRMFHIHPEAFFPRAKIAIAKALIAILRTMCMAIIALIRWTEVDCPVHYPSFLTTGLMH